MEKIIGEHFSSLEDFRSLGLIFDVEPVFIKTKEKILFLNESVFVDDKSTMIFSEGILMDGKKEGLWIQRFYNGRKHSQEYYFDGKRNGIKIEYYLNGNKMSEYLYRDDDIEDIIGFWNEKGKRMKIDPETGKRIWI